MLVLGLNPYGLSYTVGLQGMGTPRANPEGIGVYGFIRLARELGAACVEVDWRWVTAADGDERQRIASELDGTPVIYSHWLAQQPGESLDEAIECAAAIRARILRLHLTPVLEGARAACGTRWGEMIAHARAVLRRDAGRAAEAGLMLAIENHQDLGSEELLDIVGELGEHAGIVLDTGNPFAVGEDPVEFARRAARRIRHVHLKDYVAQFTNEGYRLVRCAVGEGAVPFEEILETLEPHNDRLTASIEPGALESRHIRLFTSDWWNGYPPRTARELGIMLGRLKAHALGDGEDCRTPWERNAQGREIAAYELDQVLRSFAFLRTR